MGVNPQAMLFTGGGIGSPRGPIFAMSQFLRRQIKHYLLSATQLLLASGVARVNPFLRPVGFIPVGLIAQEYTGYITIFSGGGMAEAHKPLENPTHETMRRCVAEAERETWWYLPQIKNPCAIELVMEEL